MKLLQTLFARAQIQTPVWNAQEYIASRETDNAKLGDITQQTYVTVTRKGGGWDVHRTGDDTLVHHFSTEVEARAFILKRWW